MSNGVAILTPETVTSIPEASVGVPLKSIVIVSDERAVVVVPYHSVCVVSSAPEQEANEFLALLAQLTSLAESETELTVMLEPDL